MYKGEELWSKLIGEDWYSLFPEFWDSEYMTKVLTYLDQQYKRKIIYPLQKDIFKAFKLCRVDNFKVLILGQDPYPDGSATGLAFANDSEKLNYSPSLKKILRAIEINSYNGLKVVVDPTLESWADNGVLLLNTALTVEKGKVGSHTHIWKTFTQSFLKRLSESHLTGIHVCLWGNHAKSYKHLLNENTMNIYECSHPASAHYNHVDWKCDHFKEINKSIVKQAGLDNVIPW